MSEKSEALAYSQLLLLHADSIKNPGVKDMVINSTTELVVLHYQAERLKADNERLRGLLTDASKAVWMNYDGDLLDRIEAALKEVPR